MLRHWWELYDDGDPMKSGFQPSSEDTGRRSAPAPVWRQLVWRGRVGKLRQIPLNKLTHETRLPSRLPTPAMRHVRAVKNYTHCTPVAHITYPGSTAMGPPSYS